MCIHPVGMYDLGVNPKTGKRIITGKVPRFRLSESPDFYVPCGSCLPCLDDRRKEWCGRLQAELWTNPAAAFITLTYDDAHLPAGCFLSKDDVQRFIKRFRHIERDHGIPLGDFKYFIVGEYGTRYHRPHYHGIVFGCDLYSDSHTHFATMKKHYPVYTNDILAQIWSKGFVSVAPVSSHDIAYVAKYIVKTHLDKSLFYLYSRNIGRDWFYDPAAGRIRDLVYDAYRSGCFAFRSGDKIFRSRIPRFVDRLCDRLDPDFLADVKTARREYVLSRVSDMRSADERTLCLVERLRRERDSRSLDDVL